MFVIRPACSAADRYPRQGCNEAGHKGGGGDETVCDVVDPNPESLQGPHPEKIPIARLGKDHFIGGFEAFCSQDRVAHFTLDQLLRRRLEGALAARRDSDAIEHFRWQSGEFGAGINQHFNGRCYQVFPLRIASDDIDLKQAHCFVTA